MTGQKWEELKVSRDCADGNGCKDNATAPSPSGKAADCKSAIPGSNPGGASLRGSQSTQDVWDL